MYQVSEYISQQLTVVNITAINRREDHLEADFSH